MDHKTYSYIGISLKSIYHILYRASAAKRAYLLLLKHCQNGFDCVKEFGRNETAVASMRVVLVGKGEEVGKGVNFVFTFEHEGGVVDGMNSIVLAIIRAVGELVRRTPISWGS